MSDQITVSEVASAPAAEQAPAQANGDGPTFEVFNPATGETIANVHDTSPSEVAAMVTRARKVQPAWHAAGFGARAEVMRKMQGWLVANRQEVIDTIVSETGKTYEDAHLAEITYGATAFGFWAKHAQEYLADEAVHSPNPFVIGRKLALRYRPLGVIGVIGPWNYPLTNSFGDCIPALMAGNAVILKPSEVTPLTSLLLAKGMAACGLPADVLQVATGKGDTGRALVDEVDMVMFTGSTATGKKIMAQASEKLTPVSLELGGKDPMIVLADADIERAANTAVFAGMMNSGQTCIAIERVYVEAPAYDEFVAKVVDKVRAIKQGPSTGPGTADVGAMTFPPQVDVVERHVEDAKAKGAKVLVGGHRGDRAGNWFEPTVLVDVDHSMEIMSDETFGPALPIMKVADADEAVELANDSPFGLGASVFTSDRGKGDRVSRRLEAGAVCVNDAQLNYVALELPMGGAKQSGLGTRHGAGGIRKFCAQQAVMTSPRWAPKHELYHFPRKARAAKIMDVAMRFVNRRGRKPSS